MDLWNIRNWIQRRSNPSQSMDQSYMKTVDGELDLTCFNSDPGVSVGSPASFSQWKQGRRYRFCNKCCIRVFFPILLRNGGRKDRRRRRRRRLLDAWTASNSRLLRLELLFVSVFHPPYQDRLTTSSERCRSQIRFKSQSILIQWAKNP